MDLPKIAFKRFIEKSSPITECGFVVLELIEEKDSLTIRYDYLIDGFDFIEMNINGQTKITDEHLSIAKEFCLEYLENH